MSAGSYVEHVQGGGVPGGHRVIGKIRPDGSKSRPFITPMRECNSIALRYTDVVVDIGAYVGTYAIKAARFPVRRVTAYEPTPSTFEILSSVTLPNLAPVQAAIVGDDRSEVDLFVSSGIGVTNSTTASYRKATTVRVPAVAYTEAVAGATIVKIDVEGGEYDYPIVQPGLRAIILDFHPVTDRDWVSEAERIVEEIEDSGFRPVISPRFDRSGWERAGSWIRDIEHEPVETYAPMLEGRECCGCGSPIRTEGKGLCSVCWSSWRPKHRRGFAEDRRSR